MSDPLVYLAGPIQGESYDAASLWRIYAIEALARHGITGLSPMRGKEYLAGHVTMPHSANELLSLPRSIMRRDHFDCTRADVVLAYLLGAKKPSIGTCFEMAWCYTHHVPLVIVDEPESPHDHPFIHEANGLGEVVGDLDVAIDAIVTMLAPTEIEARRATRTGFSHWLATARQTPVSPARLLVGKHLTPPPSWGDAPVIGKRVSVDPDRRVAVRAAHGGGKSAPFDPAGRPAAIQRAIADAETGRR